MARRLAIGVAGLLQLLAGGAVLVPGRRELAVEPDLGEPGLTIGDEPAADAVGHDDPLAAHRPDDLADVVEPALRLADLVGDVTHVDRALAVELGPVVEQVENV